MLLGTLQQVATVTISSAVNLLIVGLLLVAFVIIAPNGIVGLVQERLRARRTDHDRAAARRQASASASAASSRSTASISTCSRASGSA